MRDQCETSISIKAVWIVRRQLYLESRTLLYSYKGVPRQTGYKRILAITQRVITTDPLFAVRSRGSRKELCIFGSAILRSHPFSYTYKKQETRSNYLFLLANLLPSK